MLGAFRSDNSTLVLPVTESWSCISKLGLDFTGKARSVVSLFFSCPQCWQLAGSLAAPQKYCSSEAAEVFWHLTVLRPKERGFPWLQSHAVGPTALLLVWCGGRRAWRGCMCRPLSFFFKGTVPAGSKPGLKRNRWSLEAISGKDAVASSS